MTWYNTSIFLIFIYIEHVSPIQSYVFVTTFVEELFRDVCPNSIGGSSAAPETTYLDSVWCCLLVNDVPLTTQHTEIHLHTNPQTASNPPTLTITLKPPHDKYEQSDKE